MTECRQFADPDAEHALLGWLLQFDATRAGTLKLVAEDFTSPEAREVFAAMVVLGENASFIALCAQMQQGGWPRPGSMLAAYTALADDWYVASPIPLARHLRELTRWRACQLRLEAARVALNDPTSTLADVEERLARSTPYPDDIARAAACRRVQNLPRRRVLTGPTA